MMKGIVYIIVVKKIPEFHNFVFSSSCSTQLSGKAGIDLGIGLYMIRAFKAENKYCYFEIEILFLIYYFRC